jgi:hypothetical protein
LIEAQPTCPPLTGDVYDKMDDIIVTTYHSHLALGDGYFIAWGEDMAASGANATVMTRVEPVNGYNYTGTPLMIAVSGNTDAQAFLLTTTGLWSWGATGEVVGGTIVTTAAFSTMTMPPGVLPADVAEIKANSDVFFLVTSTGEVWVAGQVVTRVSGNALSTANTWHNVQTSPGVPLTDVVELTGSREAVYVRKNDNTIWTWGRGIALGGGAAATTIVYATQVDLSAIPFGVTLSQIGTYMDDAANTSGILALGSDGKVYGMGYDGAGELITNTGAFVSDWLVVQDNLGNDITDVVFLSTSDNSEELATAAIITTTASTNNLYTWGNCDFGNIGHPNGLVEFPTIPAGFNVGVSDPVYTSVGGHATSFIGRHSGGTICFVGHIRDGSGGNLQTDPLNFNCFNAADPNWEPDIELCVQQAVSLNASDDIDTTLMNTSLGIDVLENDLSGISIWDTSSLTIYINPINGIASVNPVTGIVTYTPDNGFFGIDTFSYVVCDTSAIAICDTAEVVVVVLYVNSFPTANADSEITDEDTPVTIDVLINDDFGGDGPSASSITVTTQGANGTATVDDNGTPTDPTDDQITYTPDANYNGIDNFIYEICDANGDCDTAIVNITINSVNDLPTANADSEITDEDTPVTIDVLINDDFGGDGPSASSITVTTQGANGTATVDDNGTPTDPTDDQITYTPNANYNGSDNFIYEICDANGDCDTAIVNVTINSVNDLPTANADSEITDEDTPVTIDVLINDDFGGDGPSASSITVTTQGANGTATVDDNGTPTDPTDDQITYTPNANYNGSDNYIYEICDANGDCDTAIVNVTINSVNDLPTANADSEITDEDTPVTIDVLINDDFGGDGPSASSITVTTQGANGTATVDDNGTPTDPTDDQITYTPNANYNGSDNFIYEICDANGDCDTAIVNVTINSVNDLPTANADSEITDEDTPVTIDVLINDDFGGDGPSASSITVTTQGANGTATVDDNGTPTDPTDDQITYTPNANYNGSDNFIYEICDANGDCDTAIVNVTINSVNDLPTANADSEITDEDTPVTIDVLINDDFGGDGPSNSSITVTTQGANGTATVDDNGTPTDPTDDQITYTPDANYNGSDNFIYEICDANGDCDTAIVNVTINLVNDLPTANADSEITDEDTPVTIDVLINDDFGGDGPSNSSITVTTQGANGTATVDDNGTPTDPTDDQITYTPDANYNGIDNFIYEICDANGDCDTAIVNVTINSVNDLPSANTDSEITDEDTPVTIDVLINDDFGGDGPSASSITVTTQGANGTATVDDNGTPTDPTDDQITYTPDANYNGIDNFIYEICDANGDCDTAIVNITINSVNDLPTANADSEITDEDTPVTIDVLINDDFGGDGPSASSITVTTQGANGTATVDDNGTPTDPTDDQITYTPNANYNGSDNFIYEICDANGDCDTAIVNVTINSVNDLPTANADSEITDEDTPVTIDVLINDDFGGDGPSASSITVTTQGANGTATVDDNGTPTDPTDDQITYTPNANYNGSDNYIYEICDANGDCDTAIVNVTINSVNDLPTANADSEITDEDTPVTIDVLINDDFGGDGPSNSSITVTTQGANGTATVDDNGTPTDPTDDQITYTPDANYNGSDNFIYEICDANGDCDTAIVNVTINSVNDLPSANTDSEITDEDTPVTIDVLINDDFGGDGPSASSITVTTQGANGTATVDDNGTPTDPTDDQITYTPDANYNGIDNFIYEICDANGDCDTAIVNVTINSVNDLPTANVDSEITDEDTPVTIDVLINDDFGGDGPSASSITVTTQGANGTATVDDNGTPTDPTDDQITYTPDANYNGSDNFIYEICDANGDCDTAIVELNITPVPDTLYVEIPEDSLVTVCTDSITNIQGAIIDVNVCENGNDGNAVISTLPCIIYTPNANFFGTDSICVLSCGPIGLCDTTIIIITVTPVNDPPVAVDDSETTPQDTPVDIDVTDNDFDIDGVIDPTTVSEVNAPSNGSITIDPNTGVITYTPNTDFVGTDEFTYSVCDNGSPVLCDEAVVTITVIPTPDTTYIPTPEEEPFTVCTDPLTNFGGEPITSVSVCGATF